MTRISGWLGPAALVVLAIVLSELPVMKQAGQVIESHRALLLPAAIGLAAFGFIVFMGAILSMLMASGNAMTHGEIEAAIGQRRFAGQPSVWRASAHRVFGATAGQEASGEASFAGFKDAWRSGEWRRDTQWRRLSVIAAGAIMLFYGLFGLLLVVGPMPIKVLAAGAMAYVTAMTARGFARA
jgi:hypothetical protein